VTRCADTHHVRNTQRWEEYRFLVTELQITVENEIELQITNHANCAIVG